MIATDLNVLRRVLDHETKTSRRQSLLRTIWQIEQVMQYRQAQAPAAPRLHPN